MNVYGIVFNDFKKREYVECEANYVLDDLVVVLTERGENVAKVVSVQGNLKKTTDLKIIRKATKEDYENYMNNLKDAMKAYKKCLKMVKDLKLEMSVLNAQYNLDRSQLLFNFTADSRIDFRDLAKKLANIYHTRIELRQVGARDKAKEIGGIGVCGGELCCLRFLNKIDTISMNMAKNQNLALNPNKINGSCGRLLCCLMYEDQNYLEASKDMPNIGDKITINETEGTVISRDVLNKKCKVLVDGEKIDYVIDSEK